MNMIRELRRRVSKHGWATISLEEFNQLQAEWITRAQIEVSENNPVYAVQYTQKSEVLQLNDERLRACLKHLTAIQYEPDCRELHADWAWDALCELAPELAKLSRKDPKEAYELVRCGPYENDKMSYVQAVEQLARDLTKG